MFGNLTGPLSKISSYNVGGSFRQIQDDQLVNATILAPTLGSSTLCNAGDTTCVPSPYKYFSYYPQTRGDFNPRLDLALGEKNVLTTRYQFVDNTATNAGVGNLSSARVRHQHLRDEQYRSDERHADLESQAHQRDAL